MNGVPTHILLVEDNPGDARILRELLAEADPRRFTLNHVDRLAAGIAAVQQGGIELVLLDLSLPDSQGFDTLLRMHKVAIGIPIVVMTGIEDETLGLQLVQAGAQDYLVKGQVTGPLLTRSLRYAAERKHAEKSLSLYREIIAKSNDAIAIVDPEGQYLEQNAAHGKLLGFSDGDLRGKTPAIHLGDEIFRAIAQQLAEHGAYVGEVTSRTATGTSVDIQLSAFAVQNEAGDPLCYVGIKRDITERKRADEALQKSEEFSRRMVESSRDCIKVLDIDGRLLWMNDEGQRMMGICEFGRVAGSNWIEFWRGSDHKVAEQALAVAKAGGMGTFHGFCPTMKGEAKWWDVAVTPMFDARGKVEQLLSVSRDITEHKVIEDALRDSEERVRSLVQSTKDAIVSINSHGSIVLWNQGAEDIFGYASEEIIGKPVTLIIPERFREAHQRGLMRASRAGRLTVPGEMFELVGLRKNGTEFPLEFTLASWRAKEGMFFTGVIRDVTERKRVEEERQKLAKDRLLLLESTGEGIYGLDRRGRCTFMNKAAANMLGYRPDEALGQDMHQLIHHSFPDGAAYPRERCHISATFMDGKGCQVEDEVYWRKDRTSFPVAYSSFPVLEQGEITGAVVIFLDCTARKRLEEDRSQRAGRLVKQQSALTGLTQSRLFQSSLLMPTLQHITALAARTLNVERVSIWRYAESRDAIHCVDLFELSHDRHITGMTLPVTSYPIYFQTLAASQIIAADDAQTDKRTAEFSPDYLSKVGISSMMDVPIYLFGRLQGVICHEHVGPIRRWTEDEQMFAVAVSNLVALAYEQGERRRAEEQLQQSQDRLRSLTARLESVREDERIRIAREIHDELGQALTGVKLELSLLRDQMPEGRPALLATLESISKLVDTTIQSVRRIATELRPVVLDQLGLIPAIEWQAREFQSRAGIQCTLDIYLRSVSLSQVGSTAMFRIFQEILTNVARHARASAVNITLQEQAGTLVLEVRDNGRGVSDAELADPKSLGLVGMRERALLLGGETTINGTPGKGTTVKVRIPLDHNGHDGS